jgi:hypothetical protein
MTHIAAVSMRGTKENLILIWVITFRWTCRVDTWERRIILTWVKKKGDWLRFMPTTGHFLLTYRAAPFLRSCNFAAIQKIPSNFKESEGSSLCSQEPSTGPYPGPVRSSPHHPILSL